MTRDTIYNKQKIDFEQLYKRMEPHVPMPSKLVYDAMTDLSKQ